MIIKDRRYSDTMIFAESMTHTF